jgi:hypothetical protein
VSTSAKRRASLFVDANGEWRVPEKSELDPNVSSNFFVAMIRAFPVSILVNTIALVLVTIFAIELISVSRDRWAANCTHRRCR